MSLRLPSLALALALGLASLAGCTGDADRAGVIGTAATGTAGPDKAGPDTAESEMLTPAAAREALLTVENLSADFAVDDAAEDGDDDAQSWGCLDFDDISSGAESDGDEVEAEVEYAATPEPGLPGIFHLVTSAPSVEHATEAMDTMAAVMRACRRVDTTDDGTGWEFDVSSDEEAWATDADQQVNLHAQGSTSSEGLTLPVSIHLSVVRIGNAVSMVGFFDMSADVSTPARAVADAAARRLSAVVSGEAPETPVPVLEDYPIGAGLTDLIEPDQSA